MPLPAGLRLGSYEDVSLLGAGGMGEVYRARDARLQRDVAIKVLHGVVAGDPERLARFEQEARATAALNHPNILAVFDLGEHEGAPFIVSELLDGQSLRELLGTGALPPRKAIEIGVQIAHGLAAAHETGIVHRSHDILQRPAATTRPVRPADSTRNGPLLVGDCRPGLIVIRRPDGAWTRARSW